MAASGFCVRAASRRGALLQPSTTFSLSRNAVSKLVSSPPVSKPGCGPSKFTTFANKPTNANSTPRFSLFNSSRIPVELGCASSLMPLHSATASALFTSLLSLHSQNWGSLSEGFATPL